MPRPALVPRWRHCLLFASALLAGGSVHAQTSLPPPLTALQERAAASAARFVQPAADEYRPEQFVYRSWAEGDWANETRVTRTYDGALLEREGRYRWEGDIFEDWVESGYTVYTYFEGGLISSDTQYEQTATGPVPVDRDLYDYEGEVVSKLTSQVWDGSAWVNGGLTEFTVANGRTVAWQDAEWDGTAWVPTERAALTEADGDVLQTHEVWDGAGWASMERTVYPDHTIAQLIEEFEEFASTLTEYEGLLFGFSFPTTIHQEWDGDAWVDVSRTRRERWYDVWTGAVAREELTSEAWDGGAWVPETRFVTVYSMEEGVLGAPSQTSMQVFDGGGWADLIVETYIIQNDNRRVVQATQQMDVGVGLQNVSQVLIDWEAFSTDAEPGTNEAAFTLAPNAPNPFASGTTIAYELATAQTVRLTVFDGRGREVAVLQDGEQSAGPHRVVWEATGLPAGVYLFRLEAGGQAKTGRALLVR